MEQVPCYGSAYFGVSAIVVVRKPVLGCCSGGMSSSAKIPKSSVKQHEPMTISLEMRNVIDWNM